MRNAQKQFVAEGSKLVLDMIHEASSQLKLLCCTNDWYANHHVGIKGYSEIIRIIKQDELKYIANLVSTEEVLAVFDYPEFNQASTAKDSFIIYLDRIRDPGNLGTILRTADWFGIPKIYCSPDSVDCFNNKCIQASMASIMRVQVESKSWNDMMKMFPEYEPCAATIDGESIYGLSKDSIKFICLGNEASGVSENISDHCKRKIAIPAARSLGAESLNVAVACSVILAWKFFG